MIERSTLVVDRRGRHNARGRLRDFQKRLACDDEVGPEERRPTIVLQTERRAESVLSNAQGSRARYTADGHAAQALCVREARLASGALVTLDATATGLGIPGRWTMDVVAVELVQAPTAEVRDLIGELDRTLAREYLPKQQHGLRMDAIFQPHVRFFVARVDGVAVGCGGVALFETYGEVKRMFVRDSARGRGIGQALLSRLEQETRKKGLDVLRLETGDRQLAAIRLYERAGFQRCKAFGEYASMTAQAIETSVFYEKRLSSAAR